MLPFVLSITLVGTIVSTKMSLAVFETADRGKPNESTIYVSADPASLVDIPSFAPRSERTTTFDDAPTVAVEVGQTVGGWTVDRIEPRIVYVHRGKERCRLDVGDSPGADVAILPAVEVERHGDDVVLTASLRDHLRGAGLVQVLMDAAATPVRGGYAITDIEPGSIYERVGLKDGDVVTEIDGTALTDPWTAVKALKYAAAQDAFTVRIQNKSGDHLVQVRIR